MIGRHGRLNSAHVGIDDPPKYACACHIVSKIPELKENQKD